MINTAIVILALHKSNIKMDLEIPLDITANEMVFALNTAFHLGINTERTDNCYLKTENPIALLKGNKLLSEIGIRNGTIINFTD